jgi:hypothetical protein
MSWGLDRGMIEVNPIAGLKPPHKEHARERTLTDHEVSALLRVAEAEGYAFGDVFRLLVLTAQRCGEVRVRGGSSSAQKKPRTEEPMNSPLERTWCPDARMSCDVWWSLRPRRNPKNGRSSPIQFKTGTHTSFKIMANRACGYGRRSGAGSNGQ